MKVYLDPEDIRKMEEGATCLRDRLLVRLLFRTGIRVSEAVSMGVEDVDLETGMVRILHLKERLHLFCPGCGARLGRSHRFCPGCGGDVPEPLKRLQETRRQRILPLDKGTRDMMRDFIGRRGQVTRNGRQLLFGIGRGQAWRVVHEAARRAGLGPLVHPDSGKEHGVSPHRLRDAFAVHAVKVDDSGDGLRLLQEHLGHTSFNTTARYRKVSGREHRDWYDRLWKGPPDKNAPGEGDR